MLERAADKYQNTSAQENRKRDISITDTEKSGEINTAGNSQAEPAKQVGRSTEVDKGNVGEGNETTDRQNTGNIRNGNGADRQTGENSGGLGSGNLQADGLGAVQDNKEGLHRARYLDKIGNTLEGAKKASFTQEEFVQGIIDCKHKKQFRL